MRAVLQIRTVRERLRRSRRGAGQGGGSPCGFAEGQAGDACGTGQHAATGANPGANAPIYFRARVAEPALPCVDAEFGDADFLAARPSASRRQGRRQSRPVRPQLRRRAPDLAADATCESRPVRATVEMRGA